MEQYGLLMSIEMAASLVCVIILGVVKTTPKVRYWLQAIGFSASLICSILAYLSTGFVTLSVFLFLSTGLNMVGNSILNAALMLALPDENRGAILGFIEAACVGGCALSAVIYGLLGDLFPLYLVFVAGAILTLVPMVFACFHRITREFLSTH
jgi:MFS family permease